MIIPIFVPHCGCPNDCAFCNQRTISGTVAAPTINDAKNIIESHLQTMGGTADQIAFFGGSFTGIDVKMQNEYLSLARIYVDKGLVKSIRLSTRPDYIDKETVLRLKNYGVENIELGAQSMDDGVLSLSNRGHDQESVRRAAKIIKASGVTLGLQMMTGLPGDSVQKDMDTARSFYILGASETRIYPTLVLKGTQLENMYLSGTYKPQKLEDAVSVCAQLYEFFEEKGIRVLRVGLPESDNLRENISAGPYHPSIGELVMSRIIRNKAERISRAGKSVVITADSRYISRVYGNKKCNLIYFKENGIDARVKAIDGFGTVSVEIEN